jgi:hypothetical protein
MVFLSFLLCGLRRRRSSMFVVQCPQCGSMIEIPEEAVAPERAGPWNMVECGDCERIVAFDQDELRPVGDSTLAR